jgi:5-methyltetrahydrofolate--homocysteine methyltransferase
MIDLQQVARHVIDGHTEAVSQRVLEALAEGVPPETVLAEGLIAGMAEVAARFRDNEIFVPEVLVSARAMKAGLEHLEPIFSACGIPPVGTFVIGTVKGDIHDIGKNLVGMMLRGAGFRVIDVGVNASAQKFMDAIAEHRAQVVGMSALLTTTMGQMKLNIDAIRAAGLDVKVLVGGAPVSVAYAERIGADAHGANAAEAVEKALRLVGAPAPGV